MKSLTVEESYLFLYLITNPHTHVSGIYHLPLVYAAAETKLKTSHITACLKTLEKLDLAYYDPSTEIVWIRKMLSYQGAGRSIKEAIDKHIKSLHPSNLTLEFCKAYGRGVPEGLLDHPRAPQTLTVSVSVTDRKRESEGKTQTPPPQTKSTRIKIAFFTEDIKPDAYCLQYAKEHEINGNLVYKLWQRMIDWHISKNKGSGDLHASWRTWVGRAPDYNADLFYGQPAAQTQAKKPENPYKNYVLTEEEKKRLAEQKKLMEELSLKWK